MTLRNVPKSYTLEEQRQEINLLAVDLDTAVDGVQTFNGAKTFANDVTFQSNINVTDIFCNSISNNAGGGATFSIFNTGNAEFDGTVTASSFSGSITGNADTATALETARNIAGQSFDGTADITIAATDLSDTDQALSTTSDVTFNTITKSGGLATEFLKADGSVDSTTYLSSETDPVFTASEASSITSTDTSNWNTAYGWGDHGVEGYLTSYTETDPVVGAINGIVKADGAGNISAAVAGTDYATAAQGALADTALQAETITLATLKAEVAAATDFADFQSRIAAL